MGQPATLNLEKIMGVSLVVCFFALYVSGQVGATSGTKRGLLDVARRVEERKGRLDEILVVVSKEFKLPMIIELAQPMPDDVRVGAGTFTARDLLDKVCEKNSVCRWDLKGQVVLVYDDSVRKAARNFLNWRLEEFKMPGNVADLDLRLRGQLNSIKSGVKGKGGLVQGIRSDELSKLTLSTRILRNTTAREILWNALQESRRFTTIIVFPSRNPTKNDELDLAFRDWRWVAIN